MIAGLRFADACAIADVSQLRIHDVLPARWLNPPPFKRYQSWRGERLEALRIAYSDRDQLARDIAKKHGIDVAYLYRLAVRHGWPLRRDPRREKGRLRDRLTREQYLLYRKMIANGIPGRAAYAEALR